MPQVLGLGVAPAAMHLGATQPKQARRAERRHRNLPRGPGGQSERVPRRDLRVIAGGTQPGVERVEDKIEAPWGDLEAIPRNLDDAWAAEQALD